MSNIKIRDLPIASSTEIKPGNFLVCALDENSGLPKLTRKLTLEQAVSGGFQSSSISIPPSSLPIATTNDLGVIKVGSNLDINSQGVLSVNSTGINAGLPIATTNDLGVIKVGSNLDINAQGVLSVDNSAVNATHTGDATGSTSLTLATVNPNAGSFTNANITVNAKGLVTSASNGGSISRYDSGWVAASPNTSTTFTHNLNIINPIIQVYYATNNSGANMQQVAGEYVDTSANYYGAHIQNITSTTLEVKIWDYATTSAVNSNRIWSGAYIRVVAL